MFNLKEITIPICYLCHLVVSKLNDKKKTLLMLILLFLVYMASGLA